jgi:hypothetical protein
MANDYKRDYPLSHSLYYDEFSFELRLPEHRLMAAVLERAIMDYCGTAMVEPEHKRSAERFFFPEEEYGEHFFSLYSIGEHVTDDAKGFVERVRRYVKGLRERKHGP